MAEVVHVEMEHGQWWEYGNKNPEDGSNWQNPKTSEVVRWLPTTFKDDPKISVRFKKASEYFRNFLSEKSRFNKRKLC